jgi:hypothetical protein
LRQTCAKLAPSCATHEQGRGKRVQKYVFLKIFQDFFEQPDILKSIRYWAGQAHKLMGIFEGIQER